MAICLAILRTSETLQPESATSGTSAPRISIVRRRNCAAASSKSRETVKRGRGTAGRLAIQIGGFLHLGSLRGDAELRSSYERIVELTTTLSHPNKVDLLIKHHRSENALLEVDLDAPSAAADDDSPAAWAGYALLSGAFRYRSRTDGYAVLESAAQWAHGDGPFLCVALDTEQFTQRHQVFMDAKAGTFRHTIFCQCVPQSNAVWAEPFAIWLDHSAAATTADTPMGRQRDSVGRSAPRRRMVTRRLTRDPDAPSIPAYPIILETSIRTSSPPRSERCSIR